MMTFARFPLSSSLFLNAFPHAGGIGMRRQKGGIVSVHGIIQLNRCLSQQDVTDGTANKVGLHDDIMP